MNSNKIKLLNFILFLDFVIYIFSNLIIFKYSSSTAHSIFTLCIRDIIIFLFSIVLYTYFCNSKISSIILFPKINNKIIKNSIIIGLSFYFVANGINLIFTHIFKFTLKNTVYLNSIYDVYDLGIGFIFYIVIYTIFVEIFFRGILNDAYKFLPYKIKLVLTAFIFAIFFFGLSQFFYGFILGILLMSFFNKVGNIGPVIIASSVVNVLNYVVKLIGKNVMSTGVWRMITVLSKGDIFTDFLFPVIIILLGLIIYSIFEDKIKVKNNGDSKKLSNVTELTFNMGVRNIVDIYFILFLVFSIFILFVSYVFLG